MKFFGRHRDEPAEELKPAPLPPPLPAPAVKPDPVQPLQINDEKFVSLLKALRPKEKLSHILKDLEIDPTKLRLVVGGATHAAIQRPDHESPGPIV